MNQLLSLDSSISGGGQYLDIYLSNNFILGVFELRQIMKACITNS
jgi:hypothetical protein